MAWVAKNADTGDIVMIEDADAEAEFSCPDCDAPVSYVREHRRKSVEGTVGPFFRFYDCAHAGVTPSESSGGGGGGGGPAESDIHKQRKWTALQEAIDEYGYSSYSTEKRIGSKRADAVLQFQEPHPEYGRGFVIEYQHKNESKDIPATEQHYARYEYTTLWLWESEFKSLTGVPEVDLFGGRVCTPFPYAVPEQSDWYGPGHFEQREKWREAHDNDLTDSEVPARIVKDWVLPTTREYWEGIGWEAAFRSPDGEYNASEYRLQAAIPQTQTTITAEAELPHDWFWPTPREHWENKGWDAAFIQKQSEGPLDSYRQNSEVTIKCSIPPNAVDGLIYERLRLDQLPANPLQDVSRGDLTEIPVFVPPNAVEKIEKNARKYTCRNCIWAGNEYRVKQDGSVGGTAVCPQCGSGIRINMSKIHAESQRPEADP